MIKIKTPLILSIVRIYLNIVKAIYDKPTASKLSGERLRAFSLRSKTRQAYSLSPLSFNILLEVLVKVTGQEKEINWRELERKK